jgi:hypothetical protein
MKRASSLLFLPLLLVAACGGGRSGDGVASAGGGKASARTRASASLSPEQARLIYARCLRQNGVPDYPDDPKKIPSGGIAIPQHAMEACAQWQKAMGGYTVDPNDPQTRDRFLKLARCMRAHGFDWPDPKPGSLGGPPPDMSGVKNKARMEATMKDCSKSWVRGTGG